MTPAQQRLFELRLQTNASREANLAVVAAEQAGESAVTTATRSALEAAKAAKDEARAAAKASSTSEKVRAMQAKLLNDSVDAAAWRRSKSSAVKALAANDKRASLAEDADLAGNQVYRHYAKRGAANSLSLDDYRSRHGPASAAAAAADPAGMSSYADPARVAAMRADLAKQAQRAAKNRKRKRRAINPDEDVDYVNAKNRKLNKDLEAAYGKYTEEIKRNIERGTAL